MKTADRIRARRRAAARLAAEPPSRARAVVVDDRERTPPAWARRGWRPARDRAEPDFARGGDGYRAWIIERETGAPVDAPRVEYDWMGHARISGAHPFGWRVR